MSNTTDSITERLKNRADEQLRKEIEDGIKKLRDWFVGIGRSQNEMEIESGDKTITLNAHSALDALREHAFGLHCDLYRANAISQFMDKVETLGQQVEEMKQSIQQ